MKLFLLAIPVAVILLIAGLGFGYDYFYEKNVLPANDTSLISGNNSLRPSDIGLNLSHKDSVILKILKEKNYQDIVSRLDSAEQLNDGRVGFGGFYTWEFACYEQLATVATDKQLIYLLKHKKPIVRAYAFKALAKRKKDIAKANFKQLKYDTSTICVMGGCIIRSMNVSQFAEQEIKY